MEDIDAVGRHSAHQQQTYPGPEAVKYHPAARRTCWSREREEREGERLEEGGWIEPSLFMLAVGLGVCVRQPWGRSRSWPYIVVA